jgi:hypothetical protein
MTKDRFGNPHAPSLAYARGRILTSTEDDYRKLRRAWSLIRAHGPESVFVFTGLEHGLAMTPEEVRWADDELAPAVYADRLRALALAHLGGLGGVPRRRCLQPADRRHPRDPTDAGAARYRRDRRLGEL